MTSMKNTRSKSLLFMVTLVFIAGGCVQVPAAQILNNAEAVIPSIEDDANFPWVVRIQTDHGDPVVDCPGTLITLEFVLTDSSCINAHITRGGYLGQGSLVYIQGLIR